jgi:hypothetical protein
MRITRSPLAFGLLSVLFLAAGHSSWAAETGQGPATQTLRGDVLVRAEDNRVVVALDEADADGDTDGRVDRLFVFLTLEPVLPPVHLRDSWAEIETRPMSFRVIAHTEKRELDFLMHRTPRFPLSKSAEYPVRSFEFGLNLYRYSGKYLNALSLEDVADRGDEALRIAEKSAALDPDSGTEIDDFNPDPTDSGAGSSCQPTCSKTCGLGSCSAACNLLGCAKCECLGDPKVFPSCGCYLK